MATDCIFCKIAAGEMKADIIYDDDKVVAFRDINPQAPIHILIIPRKHIPTLNDIADEDKELMGHIVSIIKVLADREGIADKGYRMVANCNHQGGQAVYHIHFHLLGGRNMQWPPG